MESITHKLAISTRIGKATDSESSKRYALGSIHVAPAAAGGAWLSASDSRIAAVVPVASAEVSAPVLMPAKITEGATRGKPLTVTANGRWENSKGKFEPLAEPGRFPALEQVINGHLANDFTAGEYVAVALNAQLLYQLADAITPVGEMPEVTLYIRTQRDEETGLCERCVEVSGEAGFGAIMPLGKRNAKYIAETRDAQIAAYAADFKAANK